MAWFLVLRTEDDVFIVYCDLDTIVNFEGGALNGYESLQLDGQYLCFGGLILKKRKEKKKRNNSGRKYNGRCMLRSWSKSHATCLTCLPAVQLIYPPKAHATLDFYVQDVFDHLISYSCPKLILENIKRKILMESLNRNCGNKIVDINPTQLLTRYWRHCMYSLWMSVCKLLHSTIFLIIDEIW